MGHTSRRRSWNIKKISADHFPMPRTVVRLSDDLFVAFPESQPAAFKYHGTVENLGGEVLQGEDLVA